MDKNLTVKDKIFAFLSAKGITKTEFYTETGIEPSNFKGKNKESLPGSAMLVKILTKYPDLSADWLLTGQGDMMKQEGRGEVAHQTEDGTEGVSRIPLVSPTVAAGFGNDNFAIAETDVKDYYTIRRFRHTHIDFMIEVTGDSMTPHLNSGDIIACAIVRDSQFIQWNKCHVIATAEQGLLVKRLMPGCDDNHLRAVSDNTSYPAFDIPKSEITGLALVIGSVCLE